MWLETLCADLAQTRTSSPRTTCLPADSFSVSQGSSRAIVNLRFSKSGKRRGAREIVTVTDQALATLLNNQCTRKPLAEHLLQFSPMGCLPDFQ